MEGWETTKLGKVCRLQNGFAFKSELFKVSGIPVLRISSIQNDEVSDNRPVYVDPSDYEEDLTKYWIKDGDLLIAMSGATTGKVGFNNTGRVYLLNQRVGKFEPTSKLDTRFLFYFLSTKVEENLNISTGAAQPNLSSEQIRNFTIPLPPLPEQKRIVAILDEAFEAIDKAIVNTEKNLANARELLDGVTLQKFSELRSTFGERALGDVCDLKNGFVFKSQLFKPDGVPVLRISSIQDGEVCDNRPVFVDPKDYREDLAKYEVRSGDLLIAMSGATTGKVGFNNTGKVFLLNQRVGKFEPSDHLDIRYLYYFMRTQSENNLSISAGSAQPNLSTKQIKESRLPLPPQNEQAAIAGTLDALRDDVAHLTKTLERKTNALAELRRSLLAQAFAGEMSNFPDHAEAAE